MHHYFYILLFLWISHQGKLYRIVYINFIEITNMSTSTKGFMRNKLGLITVMYDDGLMRYIPKSKKQLSREKLFTQYFQNMCVSLVEKQFVESSFPLKMPTQP